MTDEKKLTDAELEGATGAGPGISSQKATGRSGRLSGGGSTEATAPGGSENETTTERSAYPDHEEPK
jgi:hypothetical protein